MRAGYRKPGKPGTATTFPARFAGNVVTVPGFASRDTRKIVGLDAPRRRLPHHDGQFGLRSGAHPLRAAEFLEQLPHRLGAHAANVVELARKLARVAQRAVERDGKAVGFVANRLDQVQDGRETVENRSEERRVGKEGRSRW